ncbi:MAG: DUF58 domain-containing protein [Actinomycetota bacterium]|nr:DUF58 domain-containing protein [Actinomycetota bacterium]
MTGFGWSLLATGVLSWLLASRLRWAEVRVLALVCLVLFVLCCAFTLGRTQLLVKISLRPQRVFAGETAAGQVSVRNLRRGRLPKIALELRIGPRPARLNMPSLGSGGSYQEDFLVPTNRRGVIPVGPASTVRGDPFGLVRRAVRWTGVSEVFVHPRIIGLQPLDTGLLRDLEGQTTPDLSMADLEFHALRDYAPGDDRRYIHWRSSAKASAGSQNGKFLIRQFLDTRRSHLTVVVDGDSRAYPDAEDFELAVAAAASVAVRAIRDEVDTTVVAGRQVIDEGTAQRALDGFARAELGNTPLAALTAQAARVAPGTSIALIVTGSLTEFSEIRRAVAQFPLEVNTLILRVDPANQTGLTSGVDLTVLNLAELTDLPRLLGAGR